jgi:hypothetical protein
MALDEYDGWDGWPDVEEVSADVTDEEIATTDPDSPHRFVADKWQPNDCIICYHPRADRYRHPLNPI